MKRICATIAAFTMLAFSPALVSGDTLELANGDTLTGKVIAMDDNTVKIQNEILGEISIPRDKVAAVILGDRPARPPRVSPQGERGADAEDGRPEGWWRKYGETPEEIVENLAPKDFGPRRLQDLEGNGERFGTPEEAVEQLRREGVPLGLKEQLQLLLPGFGTPQVQDYFDTTVEGLATGSITLDDLREDAVEANEQLKDLQKDLGDSGRERPTLRDRGQA
ncbi:MAG: hypothetical protein KY475_19510, partial [Planctomycetes bacterium]|nr:hypothetical protein [Planctomycetota bacterium]